MTVHKRTSNVLVAVGLGLSLITPAARGQDAPEPVVPEIADEHRSFLSRVARRTVRDAILGRPEYKPEYVPEPLQAVSNEVIVRLNQQGYLRATAAAGPAPIVVAVRDAAHAAAATLSNDDSVNSQIVNEMLIEIEVVGEAQPLTVRGDWTKPRALDSVVEPGVHGLVLKGEGLRHRFCPSELYTSDQVLAEALEQIAKASRANPSQLSSVRLARFHSVHWYEPDRSGEIVSLHRGLTILGEDVVSQEAIDRAIEQLARYMVYRQQASGLFAYQYEPGRDRFSDKQNVVRQVGAVVAMALHAKWAGASASRAAADLGLRYHLQGLSDVPDAEDASFIATADGRHKLGVTALLCLAMGMHPDAERFEETRGRLIRGILRLQQPSGMFMTAFPPALSINAQDYFPGEALLAMASDYHHRPTAQVLDAFHHAISFYQAYFREMRSPAFVPWQVQAFSLMAQHTKRQDYAEYVFALTDWLAEKQLDQANCKWPELWGGVAAYGGNRVGVSTAAYLEGFADALALAREIGDVERERRYDSVVRRATRFVMQLQVRKEEAYFMRSPRDAVGGIRTGPSLNLLRIDHCQHALIGLIKARRVLYPDRG